MNEFSKLFIEHRRQTEEHNLKRTVSLCAFLCIASALLMYIFCIIYALIWRNDDLIAFGYTPTYCIRYYLSQGFISIFCMALPFACAVHTLGGAEKLCPIHRTKPLYMLCVIIFGLGACMAFQYLVGIWDMFLGFFGVSNNSFVPYCNNGIVAVLMFIMLAVVPALVEEFIYRGVILYSLKDYGTGMAIVISAVLFGLGHFSLSGTPFAFLIGLVLGLIAVKSQSLVPTVIIHLLNNTYALLYNVFCTKSTSEVLFIVGEIIPCVLILLGIITFIVLIVRNHFLNKEENSVILSSKDKASAVLANGGMITFVLLFLLIMLIPMLNFA